MTLNIGLPDYQGEWDYTNPTFYKHEEVQTPVSLHPVGKGIEVGVRGARLVIFGGRTMFYMHQSMPGSQSIWYAIDGTRILYDTFKNRLRKRTSAKAERMESGPLYVFSKEGLKRFKVPVHPCPASNSATPDQAPHTFMRLMITAAKEMFAPWAGQPIVSLLSGGTDGLLTTWALAVAGFDVRAVCVGTSEEDFDPKWARLYAEEMKIPYQFVEVPKDEQSLVELLNRTVAKTGMSDYSNVLMGMCSTLANDYAHAIGAKVIAHGHLADDVIGNEMYTVGEYRKRVAAGMADTSENWTKLRYDERVCMSPNTVQVDTVTRGDGLAWRTLWAHPDVLDFVLACPIEVCPTAKDKPLYQQALADVVTDASWLHTHKVGYYTGSGIGELRKSRPYLSDEAMREALKNHLS